MNLSDYISFHSSPKLRDPILLAAFAGWNDAAQAATSALLTLCRAWPAERFADIHAEEFFVFSETRPTISLDATGMRSVHWPANRFFSYRQETAERDILLLIGTEPQLRWKSFCRAIVEVAGTVNASTLVTLGGLLADIPHTVEPRLQGFASSEGHVEELKKLNMSLSSYQGPTGIVGALHDAWQQTGKPAFSLWGSVPHYISASPNPQVTLALLEKVSALLDMDIPLGTLERDAKAFRSQVDEALLENPEALEYVRTLEEQYNFDPPPTPSEDLLTELEEFLKGRRPPD